MASSITRTAAVDDAHVGDIRGALGTIPADDSAPRSGLSAKLKTLLAIVGPGLIVMCGDNDAGAFSTYGQAGQNYGTRLLWTLLLLVPVLYVIRRWCCGSARSRGRARPAHHREVREVLGRAPGHRPAHPERADPGHRVHRDHAGSRVPRRAQAGRGAARGGRDPRRGIDRQLPQVRADAVTFCAGSLLLIPLYFLSHPSGAQMARGFVTPGLPGGSGQMATVMLLIIGIVGTTVAPWQLFFQQSYVVDKRITPRFIRYEKVDLWIGIVIVVVGAAALMGATAAAFAHSPTAGHFTDAVGLAHGITPWRAG